MSEPTDPNEPGGAPFVVASFLSGKPPEYIDLSHGGQILRYRRGAEGDHELADAVRWCAAHRAWMEFSEEEGESFVSVEVWGKHGAADVNAPTLPEAVALLKARGVFED